MHWCKWMFWIFEFNSESYCELLDEAKQNFSDFTQVEKAYRGMEKAVVKLNTKFNWESLLQWSSTQSLSRKTFEKTPLSGKTKMVKQNSSSFSHLESQANLTKCGEINMVKKKLLKLLIAESQANFRDYPPNFWSCQNNAKLPAYDQPYVSLWMSSISSINCPNNFCLNYLIYTTWSYHSSMYLLEKQKKLNLLKAWSAHLVEHFHKVCTPTHPPSSTPWPTNFPVYWIPMLCHHGLEARHVPQPVTRASLSESASHYHFYCIFIDMPHDNVVQRKATKLAPCSNLRVWVQYVNCNSIFQRQVA